MKKRPKPHPQLQHSAEKELAWNLRASDFWFTICPVQKVAHLGPQGHLRCEMCDGITHEWLRISRAEAKMIADGKWPASVARFIDEASKK